MALPLPEWQAHKQPSRTLHNVRSRSRWASRWLTYWVVYLSHYPLFLLWVTSLVWLLTLQCMPTTLKNVPP
jgi:hypothetical protein